MGKSRILVVDDVKDIVDLLTTALSHAGYETVAARDGEQALQQFESAQVEAVVLDLNLPKIPGWEVYETIKARREDLPIIVITGLPVSEENVQALMPKADAFFQKPLVISDLLACVQRLVPPESNRA